MRHSIVVLICAAVLLLAPGAPVTAQPAAAPCCGPITQDGRRLAAFLDHSGVDRLWLAHIHVNWLTGEPDPLRPRMAPHATHCSAFAAAMATRLGIDLLHPPQHSQALLATAQAQWLSKDGGAEGWHRVNARMAQSLANRGWFVVASYANPNPRRPGHIAVLRPSRKSAALLWEHGPEETQAGFRNRLRTYVAWGFAEHPGAWEPGGRGSIRFYAHPIDWHSKPAP